MAVGSFHSWSENCKPWCCVWDNEEKYCRAGQATDDNVAHELCMLDT